MKRLLTVVCLFLCLGSISVRAQFAVFDVNNFVNTLLTSGKTAETALSTSNILVQSKALFDETKQYYDALKSINAIVRNVWMVKESLGMVVNITELQYNGISTFINSKSYTADEIMAISVAYKVLMDETIQATKDISNYVNPTSLSLTDKDRMDVIEVCYKKIKANHRLARYMTNKYAGLAEIRKQKSKFGGEVFKPLYGWDGKRYGTN